MGVKSTRLKNEEERKNMKKNVLTGMCLFSDDMWDENSDDLWVICNTLCFKVSLTMFLQFVTKLKSVGETEFE